MAKKYHVLNIYMCPYKVHLDQYNLLLLIIHVLYIVMHSECGYLEDENQLRNMCCINVLNTSLAVECFVTGGETITFEHIRDWLEVQSELSAYLSIVCTGGVLQMQWPFMSSNLKTLSIDGCVIEGLLSERNGMTQTKMDMLDSVQLINLVFKIDSEKMKKLSQSLRRISLTHECGPKNMKTYVWKNVSAKLIPPIPDFQVNHVDAKQWCEFSKIKVFENTLVPDVTPFNLQMLVGRTLFPQLDTLNLSSSRQVKIPRYLESWRLIHPKLTILDLSHNMISWFSFTDYAGSNPKMGYIDLRYNNITTLGTNEIKSMKNLQSTLIDVRHNDIDCSCHTVSDLHKLLHTYKSPIEAGFSENYIYLWQLQCSTPFRFHGKVISNISQKIICDTDQSTYITLICILSFIALILLLVIILVTRYRKDILILVYTRIFVIIPCGSMSANDSKQYDAFISYSKEDSEWVITSLLPFLEQETSRCKLKICIRDRDCMVGVSISEQIVTCVENSRHTILVLSDNFLGSEWCRFEFRTALSESVNERKSHMIIIILGSINMSNIEPDLRRCLQTRTYLKTDDRLFWDRIRYALTCSN